MFDCPKCKSETVVPDSRSRSDGGVRRRRRCKGCGFRFTTHEVIVSEQTSNNAIERAVEGVALASIEFINRTYLPMLERRRKRLSLSDKDGAHDKG